MLCHPGILGGPPKRGQNQKSKPTPGVTIRSGCATPAFSAAYKWAEMLQNRCILGDPQRKRDKIRIGYLTPAFSEAHKWSEMRHSGSVRRTKQTLPPKKGGGGFGNAKTLLWPKNLANEKRGGGYVKPPMPSCSAETPCPPPPADSTVHVAHRKALTPRITTSS